MEVPDYIKTEDQNNYHLLKALQYDEDVILMVYNATLGRFKDTGLDRLEELAGEAVKELAMRKKKVFTRNPEVLNNQFTGQNSDGVSWKEQN